MFSLLFPTFPPTPAVWNREACEQEHKFHAKINKITEIAFQVIGALVVATASAAFLTFQWQVTVIVPSVFATLLIITVIYQAIHLSRCATVHHTARWRKPLLAK